MSYRSGSVDGRIASTNNQSSWVGAGWDYSPGFVERSYVACADDPAGTAPKVYDLCWAGQRVTLSLKGQSMQLVRDDATGVWHSEGDDGTKVELLTGASNGALNGEYWRITTTDGTRYFFGKQYGPGRTSQGGTGSTWTVPVYGAHPGDPCYSGSGFAASSCQQAWRWNLDLVQDTHGNAAMYYYTPETNGYGPNNGNTAVSYIRSGTLNRIEYGLREVNGSVYGTSTPNRVFFITAERCVPDAGFTCDPTLFTAANAARWPDTPQDQACPTTGTCANHQPTFWSTKRLTTIVTQVETGTGGGSVLRRIDDYTLGQSFPGQGDPQMWLASITHRGYDQAGNSLTTPPVTFTGNLLDNRVLGFNGLTGMLHWRLTQITTETGRVIAVTYSAKECTSTNVPANASTNTMRCFPVYWTRPYQSTPTLDWFHTYVVTQVNEGNLTGGVTSPTHVTKYTYLGAPAWHYDDNELVLPAFRTWGQFRGYSQVETLTGDPTRNDAYTGTTDTQTLTRATYYRGMDGDTLPAGAHRSVTVGNSLGESVVDANQYAGAVREVQTFASPTGTAATQLSSTITDESTIATTATRARPGLTALTSQVIGATKSRTRTTTFSTSSPVTVTGALTATTALTLDPIGRVTQRSVTGDGVAAQCTTTSYADNVTAGIRVLAAEVTVSAQTCPAPGATVSPIVSATRTFYDGSTILGSAPSRGDPTQVNVATTGNGTGGVAAYATTKAVYDPSGRPTSTTRYRSASDPTGVTTSTGYTQSGAGLLSKVTSTNALGQASSAEINWRGQATRATDIAGHITDTTYDPLGRVANVWRPGQTMGATPPTVAYTYLVRTTGPNAVTTTTLIDTGTAATPAYSTVTSVTLYDGLGQQLQTQTQVDGGRTINLAYYDSHGWVTASKNFWWGTGAPSTDLADATDSSIDSRAVSFYDSAGRPTRTVAYKGLTATWDTKHVYGGDRTTTIPPNGSTATTNVVNAAGQTTTLWQWTSRPALTGSGNTGYTMTGGTHTDTTYTYDAAGRTATTTPPGAATGLPTTFTTTYDLAGRVTSSTDPDTGTTTTSYNDLGEKQTITDARGTGSARTFTYDALSRPLTETRTSTGTKLATYLYDTLEPGQLTSSSSYRNGDTANPYTVTATGYDTAGRPTGTTTTIPATETGLGGGYTTARTWSSTGLPRTVTYPAVGGLPAETVTTTYNGYGQPSSTSGTNQYATVTNYNPYGQPLTVYQHENDTAQTQFGYDFQTLRLAYTNLSVVSGDPQVENVVYTRDPSGNVTTANETRGDGPSAPTRVACYRYDELVQLTAAWTATDGCALPPTPTSASSVGGDTPMNLSWTFTASGVRATQTSGVRPGVSVPTTTTSSVGTTGHTHATTGTSVVTGSVTGSSSYGYDAAGNSTQRVTPAAVQAISWSARGRIESIVTTPAGGPAVSTSFQDSADGGLVVRRDPGASTVFLPGQDVTRTTAGTLSVVRYYRHGGALVAQRSTGAGLRLSFADPAGTVTVTVDWVTYRATRRTMDPYGNPIGSVVFGPWPDSRGFLNAPSSTVTGLTDVGARTYDPALGGFLSVDPIATPTDPVSLAGYLYANNNPISYSDPSGLEPRQPGKCFSDDDNCNANMVHMQSMSQSDAAYLSPYIDAGLGTGKRQYVPPREVHYTGTWGDATAGAVAAIADLVFMPILAPIDHFRGTSTTSQLAQLAGFDPNASAYHFGSGAVVVGAMFIPGVGIEAAVVDGVRAADLAATSARAGDLATAAKAGTAGADDVLNGVRLRAQLTGQEISGGHAFGKHVVQGGEFPGITTRSQFAQHIEDVVSNGVMRPLERGRTAYWQNGTVVIRNPNAVDGGTAFRPKNGYDYFLGLE